VNNSKSWGKAWSQFQTPLFYKFSNLRETAVREAKKGNYHKASNIIGSQMASILAEQGIRNGVKYLTALAALAVLGLDVEDEKDKGFKDYIFQYLLTAIGSVPFVNNAVSFFAYGQTPISALSIAGKIQEDYKYLRRSKKADNIAKWAQILALDIFAISTGAPTPRITYLLRKSKPKKVGHLSDYLS